MSKGLLAFVAFFCWQQFLHAQTGAPVMGGARGLGLSGASVAFSDINSAWSNQAGLAFIDKMAFSAFGEQRFLMADLGSYAFAAAYPLQKVGTFALTLQHFGASAYNEQKIGLGYARRLGENFSIGIQFDYLATRIPDYGSSHNFTAELGLLYRFSSQFTLAAHIYNPFRVRLASSDPLATLFRTGFIYSPSKQVSLIGEVEKDFLYPISGKIGVEYRPHERFVVRTGIGTAPFRASFGVGVEWQGILIDFASSYHQILGFTPGISLTYQVKSEK